MGRPITITDYYFVNNLFGTVYFIKLVELTVYNVNCELKI